MQGFSGVEYHPLLPLGLYCPQSRSLEGHGGQFPHIHRQPLALTAGAPRGGKKCSVSGSRKVYLDCTCEHFPNTTNTFRKKSQGTCWRKLLVATAISHTHMINRQNTTSIRWLLCTTVPGPEDRKTNEINTLAQSDKGYGHIISYKGWAIALLVMCQITGGAIVNMESSPIASQLSDHLYLSALLCLSLLYFVNWSPLEQLCYCNIMVYFM